MKRHTTALSNNRDELRELSLQLAASTNSLAQRAFAKFQPRIATFFRGNAFVQNITGHGVRLCVCGHTVGESLDISVMERRFLEDHKPPVDPDAGSPPAGYRVDDIDGEVDSKNVEAVEAIEKAKAANEYDEEDQDDVFICENCRREYVGRIPRGTSRLFAVARDMDVRLHSLKVRGKPSQKKGGGGSRLLSFLCCSHGSV